MPSEEREDTTVHKDVVNGEERHFTRPPTPRSRRGGAPSAPPGPKQVMEPRGGWWRVLTAPPPRDGLPGARSSRPA